MDIQLLDLTTFFEASASLLESLRRLDGVWVRGGNTFVLRQAMRLSGFDEALEEVGADFLYAGYSAGVCVLAPTLDGLQHVDDPSQRPYSSNEVIWEGLGIIDYLIIPHFRSDHHESEQVEVVVSYCIENEIPFRTLRDGDVIILRDYTPTRSA